MYAGVCNLKFFL